MSNPGLSTSQLTPELLQQYQQQQDQQRQQAMAQALMQNKATGQNAGLANAGGDILGAMASNNIKAQNSPENQVIQQRYGMTPGQASNITNPSMLSQAGNWVSGLFGMGGNS